MGMEKLNVVTEILDVEEARRRLPSLRNAIPALMEATRRIKDLHRELRACEAADDVAGVAERRVELDRLEGVWRGAMAEVNALGAYVKDPESGLVDFYSWRDGEMVFLCWHFDEPDIAYWHGIHDGFSGRQPIESPAGE